MRLSLVAALLAVVAAPAVAGTEQEGDGTAKVAKEKKVCKLNDQDSTSRMRKRVCRTAKEWAEAPEKKVDTGDLQRMSTR